MKTEQIVSIMFFTALLPLACALTVTLVGRFLGHKREPTNGLAMLVGFTAGFLGNEGMPALPPKVAGDWLPFAGLAAFLVCFALLKQQALPLRVVVKWLLLAAAFFAILQPLYGRWDAGDFWGLCAGGSLLCAAVWQSAERGFHGRKDLSMLWFLVVLYSGSAGVIVAGGSISVSLLSGVLGASMGGLGLVKLFFKDTNPEALTLAVGLMVWFCILLNALIYVQIDVWALGLALAAALVPLLTRVSFFDQLGPWKRYLLLCFIGLLPITGAVVRLVVVGVGADDYGY